MKHWLQIVRAAWPALVFAAACGGKAPTPATANPATATATTNAVATTPAPDAAPTAPETTGTNAPTSDKGPTPPPGTPGATGTTQFGEQAKTLLAALERGDWAAVQPTLAADIAKAVGDGKALTAPFAQLGPCPKVLRQTEVAEVATPGVTTVTIVCQYASGPLDIVMKFDKDSHLAGLRLRPSGDAAAFGPRPQTPKPPFPYSEREVTFTNSTDQSTFGGTLTIPAGTSGKGPFPVAVLITGSGSQDRDETIFGHKPFLVLADALTRRGIAVLRVDDRGVGKSTGDETHATIALHASDVEAAVRFVRTQPEIDPKRVGLIGHSEGGILAAMVAGRSDARRAGTDTNEDGAPVDSLAFVVSLAGTGVSGLELVPAQVGAILQAKGIAKEGVDAMVQAQAKICKLAADGAPEADLKAAIDEAAATAKHWAPDTEGATATPPADQAVAALTSPWYRSFLKTDPHLFWGHVTTPVLALVGDKDTQVPAETNLREIAAALAKAGNKDATTELVPGVNHLFQLAKTGLPEEYAQIEQTFVLKALERVVSWVEQHVAAH